jgi:hypothetical protein
METHPPTIAAFIDTAWSDHADDARGVAERLPQGLALIEADPAQAAAFVHLAEHVLLGHLADGAAMQRMADGLQRHAADQPALQAALDRSAMAVQLLRGDRVDTAALAPVNAVRATAALGRAARRDADGARALMHRATALADATTGDTDVLKSLAAGWNNIAGQLQSEARHPATDPLMMGAAQRSREVWAVAGTWVNVERADYFLARCAATLGDSAQALRHAQSCLAICLANDADAYECFFAHESLGEAFVANGDTGAARHELAHMRKLMPEVGDDNRADCRGCIDKLAATLA